MSQKSELSRIADIKDIEERRVVAMDITASEEECRALAKRFGILEVREVNAQVKISAKAGGYYRVEGDLKADVIQACGVTLAPVPEKVHETFDEVLTTDAGNLPSEEDTDGDAEKPVDVIEGDRIDAGEIVAQWLALSLDPFPRCDAAPVFKHLEDADSAEGKKTYAPFEILQKLKDK